MQANEYSSTAGTGAVHCSAIFAGLAVAFDAFAAPAKKALCVADALRTFETGVRH